MEWFKVQVSVGVCWFSVSSGFDIVSPVDGLLKCPEMTIFFRFYCKFIGIVFTIEQGGGKTVFVGHQNFFFKNMFWGGLSSFCKNISTMCLEIGEIIGHLFNPWRSIKSSVVEIFLSFDSRRRSLTAYIVSSIGRLDLVYTQHNDVYLRAFARTRINIINISMYAYSYQLIEFIKVIQKASVMLHESAITFIIINIAEVDNLKFKIFNILKPTD